MNIAGIIGAAGKIALTGASIAGAHLAYKASEKVADKLVGTGVEKAIDAMLLAWSKGATQSLASYGQSLRVEPYCLLDTRVVRLPYIKDILNLAQRHFSCLYLMAQASDNTIGGIRVSKRLDKFAPDRNLTAATVGFLQGNAGRNWLSAESYQFGLPSTSGPTGLERFSSFCTEANDPTKAGDRSGRRKALVKRLDDQTLSKEERAEVQAEIAAIDAATTADDKKSGVGFTNKSAQVLQDVSDLSIGQIIDVTVTDGNHTGVLPIQIRLRTTAMEPHSLSEILALGGEDNSHSAQWARFKVGDLGDWRNLVFQTDRIDRYRRAALADKSGYLRKAVSRDNKALLATVLTGTPSIGAASSICIISKETQREAEELMSGRISDFATRQSIFDQGLMLLLFVVDADHETVTIYTRDIDHQATYAIRDLKQSSSEGKSDLTDVMRSYLEGRIPGRL